MMVIEKIRELEKEVITLRVQNRYAALQLQNIQSEIEHFSAQYHSAVEDLCLKLAELEAKIKTYEQKIASITGEIANKNAFVGNVQIGLRQVAAVANAKIDIQTEVKNLYRSLIKIVHPDVSEEKLRAAEYTMMVNKAYNERNYQQLIELDQLIRSGNATEQELRLQRNKLIDATFELKMQREDLLENPLYVLSEAFAQADDGGLNMIAAARRELERRVESKKRELSEMRISYLERIGGLIAG